MEQRVIPIRRDVDLCDDCRWSNDKYIPMILYPLWRLDPVVPQLQSKISMRRPVVLAAMAREPNSNGSFCSTHDSISPSDSPKTKTKREETRLESDKFEFISGSLVFDAEHRLHIGGDKLDGGALADDSIRILRSPRRLEQKEARFPLFDTLSHPIVSQTSLVQTSDQVRRETEKGGGTDARQTRGRHYARTEWQEHSWPSKVVQELRVDCRTCLGMPEQVKGSRSYRLRQDPSR